MKVGNRLAIGFGVVLVLAIGMNIAGILRLQDNVGALNALMERPLVKERLISDWYRNIYGGILRTKAVAKSDSDTMSLVFADDAAASEKSSGELRKKIESLLDTQVEKDLYVKTIESRKRFVSVRDTITRYKQLGRVSEAQQLYESEFLPGAAAYQDSIKKLLDLQRATMDSIAADIEENASTSMQWLIALVVIVFLVGVLCSWHIARGITRPLRDASLLAKTVAQGNLSSPIAATADDETGQLMASLKEMKDGLAEIVSRVRTEAVQIATVAHEIAAGNQDLATRTAEQASALEESAATLEQFAASVKQNAEHASHANQLVEAASAVAQDGGVIVADVVRTMSSIHDSSNRMSNIISVIDGIAFQTNILALNAAVEAARAGEQGRGFAVVASEVRALAQRSASAAREIADLIQMSKAKVAEGSELVTRAGVTIDKVVHSVRDVTTVMGEIAAASHEQSSGIDQLNRAITEIERTTQQNAALVEQASAAAESMRNGSMTLTDTVSIFKTASAV
ncbi:methyl-accepting chemotaxis protein [Noviherbaspirillum saxi]|uniref:HAMP domain-containing protein n=1 Tax=Noviherbaspirillum saxi TaxID=2320863 RepID=A0A3A3FLX1_9BURK|nr:methyl-accepting chemotaxis protein [Noviherbaspirillum saxi]RJF95475.1 HAMP domain-containing protein [Noviherbaspirillum saxi]